MTVALYGLDRTVDGVATLRITTDETPHVGDAALTALADAVDVIKGDPSIRALVLEGGEQHFCSGATRDTLLGADAPRVIARLMGGLPRLLLSLEIPTLAMMTGHAIGGGLMLGLWCDVAVLAMESLYGANFLALGFTPGMGSTVLLEEVFGTPLARDLLLTGRMIKGREIREARVPLSHAVVPRREVRDHTYALASEMAQAPRAAMALVKRHISTRRRALLERAIEIEFAMHTAVFSHPETRTSIDESYPTPVVAHHGKETA
ncbi:polyketide synthase [Kibdelosporangium philippinense]|uniref:Polyketide synthase n=1 Tax=Kibdelosporangium philippinense TaxID=211113 RepID=A0ABS8Z549_9PSEU|nr:polyketide synthase [Kibdelosporangium philippinense]MCE7002124.1 polyketide synthase [Kibdelosporangium philippinense]